mgnify:CR=1 FL=1
MPYYPQFTLPKIPSIYPFDEMSTLLRNEVRSHGEIASLEKKENSESFYYIFFSFSTDKSAVIALKSPIWLSIGNNENVYRVKIEPTPGFIKYLTDLNSSLKLQTAPKNTTTTNIYHSPSVEEVAPAVDKKAQPSSEKSEQQQNTTPPPSSKIENNKKMELEYNKDKEKEKTMTKHDEKDSAKKDKQDVPLDIVKRNKRHKRFTFYKFFSFFNLFS